MAPKLSSRQIAQLGARIRRFRDSLGITQQELSSRTGISVGEIGHLERYRPSAQRQPNPTLATMLALLGAFHLRSVEELLGPLATSTFREDPPYGAPG
jgi:transcriptional regulator with XRE-family HTH domain